MPCDIEGPPQGPSNVLSLLGGLCSLIIREAHSFPHFFLTDHHHNSLGKGQILIDIFSTQYYGGNLCNNYMDPRHKVDVSISNTWHEQVVLKLIY